MTSISPERARELLDTASPGPWEVIDEYPDGVRRPDDSHRICTESGVYVGLAHGKDATLTAAAPDLAETIAGMHYEYVVQAHFLADAAPNTWMPCDSWGLTGYDSVRANEPWAGPRKWRAVGAAEMCADNARAYGDRDVRIVRRLVTDVEVIE